MFFIKVLAAASVGHNMDYDSEWYFLKFQLTCFNYDHLLLIPGKNRLYIRSWLKNSHGLITDTKEIKHVVLML